MLTYAVTIHVRMVECVLMELEVSTVLVQLTFLGRPAINVSMLLIDQSILFYVSLHFRAANAQVSIPNCANLPEPLLLTYTKYACR